MDRQSTFFARRLGVLLLGIAVVALSPLTTAQAQDGGGDFAKKLQEGYDGVYEAPPESGPAAVRGKTVWYISCGQAFIACSLQAEGFAAAGKELGWNVSIQDGQASPSVASDLIRQAIAAKADAVAIAAFDCPGIKSSLLLARSENMPVVAMQSIDCDAKVFGDDASLFTAQVNLLGSTDAQKYYYDFGKRRADYILAKMKPGSDVVSIGETSQVIAQAQNRGFLDAMKACDDCTVHETSFNFGQVPSPATQIWQSALLQHPNAKVIAYPFDALMTLGLQTVVRQARLGDDVIVGGAEGFPANFDLIRNGTQTYSTTIPFRWFGWAHADTVNRVLAGDDPSTFPSEGTGFQYVDKDHNLPPAGEEHKVPFDYQSAYKKIWSGQNG